MNRYPRDMRGYGPNPPDAKWPGGAKIAVQFVLNYEEGGENDLLERIANDPIFGVTLDELKGIVDPHKYVGRAPRQTEIFLHDVVKPILDRYADTETETAEINL